MDIGKVVVYEHIYELVVTYPNSDVPVGLVMGIRSASSEQCKAILRKHTNEQTQANRAKQKKVTAEQLEQNELEATAASIAWWNWGKDDKGEQSNYEGTQPALSMTLAIKILGEVNWLYGQVKEAGLNLENFMPKDLKKSPNNLDKPLDTIPSETNKAEPGENVTSILVKAS